MSLLSWNCRGLARGPKIRALRALVKQHDPGVTFLMETKIPDAALSCILRNLGFYSLFFVLLLDSKVGLPFVGVLTLI